VHLPSVPTRTALTRVALRGLLVAAAIAAGACGGGSDDGLVQDKVEIDRTTTTTDRPCDVPETAERAIVEASLNARNLDAAARSALIGRFDELEATLPPELVDDAKVLRAAFDAAWATPPPGNDPFDTTEYFEADQAILRYVRAGCRLPGDPEPATTTTTTDFGYTTLLGN